jgi:hypothetical protein
VPLLEVLLEKDPGLAISEPSRTSEGDADDNRRDRRGALGNGDRKIESGLGGTRTHGQRLKRALLYIRI